MGVTMERWTITGAQGLRPRSDLIERIFARDSSVWAPGDDDPADRLGWLDLPARMGPEVGRLRSFAAAVAADGIRRVVVLGMGGSSLAPEVWAETFGSAPGYPALTVLDSTHPTTVRAATDALDLDRTLWIVSSKSGGTVETISLYRHFRSLHDDGGSFVAITDPGTSLESMAQEEDFRATFLNPPDIGGRYSALSLFGLVPAALIGADIEELLDRARSMAEACAPEVHAHSNSALQIGTAVASLAQAGRDKLTWLLSPDIGAFGGWVEQLIAESTGKRGRGIAPVVDEPPESVDAYGPDRTFVNLRTRGDSTHAARVREVVAAGHPVIEIEIGGPRDLGAEMWRWELATAVAGAVLGINAFDQPDVEAAKKAARLAMESEGGIEWPEEGPHELFRGAGPPELVALLLYVHADDAARSALDAARRKLLDEQHVATSVGFGPRYLHSTGQLHKGGPPGLRALIVLEEGEDDVGIPGSRFGFARLIAAQAMGDANALEAAGRRVSRTTRAHFEKWALS
jgi:transaldolase / glucose-6-phosphate isomerase